MQKRVLEPYKLVDAVSLASSFVSSPTSVKYLDRTLLQIVCTGAPVGTVTVQASVDGTNWFDMPLGLVALTGSPQRYFIDISQSAIIQIRINYVATSGSGTMTAIVSAKES